MPPLHYPCVLAGAFSLFQVSTLTCLSDYYHSSTKHVGQQLLTASHTHTICSRYGHLDILARTWEKTIA